MATAAVLKPNAGPVVREERIPELDGIRGVAVLLVLIVHFAIFTATSGIDRFIPTFVGLGATGVDLFFVLSGFLITGILIRSKTSPGYFTHFYGRRVVRIFPLYYAYLVIYFCFVNRTSLPQLHYWLYLSNWKTAFGKDFVPLAHFWSLSIEEQFYLVWPMIVYLVPAWMLPRACVILALSSTLVRLPFVVNSPANVLYQLTIFRLDGLGVGALIAACMANNSIPAVVESWAGRLAGFFLSFATLLQLTLTTNAAASILKSALRSFEIFERASFPLLISLGFGALLINCIRKDGVASFVMRFGWLRSFGKYSYGIYVLHFPITMLFKPRLGVASLVVTEIVGIGLSYCAALVSWNLLEKHCLKMKRYFPTSEGGARTKAASSSSPS